MTIKRHMLLEGGIRSMPRPAGKKAHRKSKKYRETPDRKQSQAHPPLPLITSQKELGQAECNHEKKGS